MTASGRKIAISAHIEVEWLERPVPALCPNCGVQSEVLQILEVDYRPPVEHDDEHRFILQICPECSVRFVDNMKMMEFHSEQQVERGEDAFHVQLGAGLWPIISQLARLDRPRGAKVLEIGGAYGFGLDFCLRARGWEGVGYDPSPFAAVGMRELDLPLRQEYFTVKHLGLGPWDVAIATELLEHVSYPAAFLLLMRQALGESGVLMLSTPDADFITPELSPAILLPMLSPGSHTVLQTAQSLEVALRAAGFTHVHIVKDGMSLTAYASGAPISLIEDDAARRAMYRSYLVERAGLAGLTSDLRFGFAGRGIFEAVNDGDWAAADAAWAALLPAAQARFGLDLQSMPALPPGAADASLAGLSRLIPLGLGMILFGRAMHLLKAGHSRAQVEPVLRLAAEAIDVLLRALARHSLQDGLTASIGMLLRTELLICAAAAGRPEVVAGLSALGDEETSWLGFVELVNAGAIGTARALKETLPELPGQDISAGLRRNALLSLVNFHLAPGGEALRVLPCAVALQAGGDNADAALLGAFTRLVNAGRHDEAQGLARRYDISALARAQGEQDAGQDAAMALAMLELAMGDPAGIADVLAALPLGMAQKEAVLLEAFVRLVNAARLEAASAFSAAHDVPGLLQRAAAPAARNARLAGIMLELAMGDPAVIPARLEGLDLPPAQREALLLQAFTRLANAARYAEARNFAATHDVPAMLRRQGGETAADAAIGLAMLELGDGDPALVPSLLAGHDIAPAQRTALLLSAFTGLVNAGRHEAAESFMAAENALHDLDRLDGEAAENARWAQLMLDLQRGRALAAARTAAAREAAGGDAARLAGVYVDGFIRLVNTGDFAAARELEQDGRVERRLARCRPPARLDALTSLLVLDAQPGPGDAARVPERLRALHTAGMEEARLTELGFQVFSMLVNQGEFAPARLLLPVLDPVLIKLRPPYAAQARDALFAAGMLYLQQQDDWRRGAASFARLRDGLVKQTPRGQTPDPLFWPALRGEVITLHRLNRGAEATALLQSFLNAYPGAPEDLREQLKGVKA